MIQEDYCSFEIAKLLKEKGFDWICSGYWYSKENNTEKGFAVSSLPANHNDDEYRRFDLPISAPTHQMARRWLREIHNVFIEVCLCWSENPREFPPQYYALILDTKTGNSLVKISDCKDGMNPIADKSAFPKYFTKYDEAVEKALKYSLEKLI